MWCLLLVAVLGVIAGIASPFVADEWAWFAVPMLIFFTASYIIGLAGFFAVIAWFTKAHL